MATVINNPNTDTTGTGGWSVALIILAIIVLGILAFFAFGHRTVSGGTAAPQVTAPTNIGTGGTGGTNAGQ